MICPKCHMEYQEGWNITCPNCGVDLVDRNTAQQKSSTSWLFTLGKVTAHKAISLLFYVGILPLLYVSISWGRLIYWSNSYPKSIFFMVDGITHYTEKEVNHMPLGILGGIASFIVLVLLWKVACELLLIIFRAIEVYIQKHKES